MQSLNLVSSDGPPVAARSFRPAAGLPVHGGVVIGGAMGVRQDYYAPFARVARRPGLRRADASTTAAWAIRGPARRASLRGFDADLFDWARDFDARDRGARRASVPTRRSTSIGHSLGAQLPGLLRNRDRIAGLVSVAAGSGYWRDNAPQLQAHRAVLLARAGADRDVRCSATFPGRRLGKVGDLPRGVVLQWRRWCLNPRYHVGAEGSLARAFAGARFPVVALSITDDELMTERGTRVLIDCYENAPRELRRIAPADVQARRIGHFGFFRDQFQATLWTRVTALFQGFPDSSAGTGRPRAPARKERS